MRARRGAIWAQQIALLPHLVHAVRDGGLRVLEEPIGKRNTRLSRGSFEQICASPPWHSTPIGTITARSAFEGVIKPVTLRSVYVAEQLLWINDGRSAAACRATPPALWVLEVSPVNLAGMWSWRVRFAALKLSVDGALRDAKSGFLQQLVSRL